MRFSFCLFLPHTHSKIQRKAPSSLITVRDNSLSVLAFRYGPQPLFGLYSDHCRIDSHYDVRFVSQLPLTLSDVLCLFIQQCFKTGIITMDWVVLVVVVAVAIVVLFFGVVVVVVVVVMMVVDGSGGGGSFYWCVCVCVCVCSVV